MTELLPLMVEHTASRLGVNPWLVELAIRNGRLKGVRRCDSMHTTKTAVSQWLGAFARAF